MKRAPRFLVVGIILVAGSGCGSATTALISDGLNVINEVSDSLRKVVDEDSAKYFAESRSKQLKEKWDSYRARVDKWIKDRPDTDLQEAAWVLAVDKWLATKTKRKGAIENIFGQQSGELDKPFKAWADTKGIKTANMSTDEIIANAKGPLEDMYKSAEPWFKESVAVMKNLKDAQDRLAALSKKSKGDKVKDATNWLTFLQ